MKAAACHSVSHSTPFVYTSLFANVYYKESLIWFEVSGQYWILLRQTSLGYPVVALCRGAPAASDL